MKFTDEKTITADKGMKLTNGTAFGDTVFIGRNDAVDNWHEITKEEAERLQSEGAPTNEATEADYISALEELGVSFGE